MPKGIYQHQYQPVLDRLWSKVQKTETCWIWQGGRTGPADADYGTISFRGRNVLVHRLVYELYVGPIPDGLEVDHLCSNPPCVRPNHLEPVTSRENSFRSRSPELTRQRQLAITHCPKGHPYDEQNTLRSGGKRRCGICRRRQNKEWRNRNCHGTGKVMEDQDAH